MKQTIAKRILNILLQQENVNPNATFNRRVANRRFRSVEDIHGTVMRRARELASNKMLRRVSRGQFVLTAKGRKSVR